MRRLVRIAGWTMVWTGLFTLGFAGYQLFVTDILNARDQEQARAALAEAFDEPAPEPVTVVVPPDAAGFVSVDTLVHYEEEPGSAGEPFAAIRIPKIELDHVVVEGVGKEDLTKGPGHMPWTPLPGQPGNAVLSGHRTTYGRPFYDLDRLQPGDVIEVESSIGVHVYTVRGTEIVAPTDVWVTAPRRGAWLTLTTCHPRFSATKRLVVFAEMTQGPNLAYAEFLEETDLADVS